MRSGWRRDANHRSRHADRQGPARAHRGSAADREDDHAPEIANSITRNNPEVDLIVLLIDERPEEVTDMERSVKGEVISSTFDEPASRHVQVAEMVIEKAKRMIEYGRDVVILLDSITRSGASLQHRGAPLGPASFQAASTRARCRSPSASSGRPATSRRAAASRSSPPRSSTPGSRMDEVIFEEFKGTGNMELHLDRRLAEKRTWPAIDITRSGTRKEELLLDPEEQRRIWVLRKVLHDMNPVEAMELLKAKLKQFKTNAEFLMSMNAERG
jgi:transcription termination factor Rho